MIKYFYFRAGTRSNHLITPSQSAPKSNSNEGILYIHQMSRTGASTSDGCVITGTLVGCVLTLCGDVISLFYSPSRLDCTYYGSIYGSNRSAWKIFVFDRKT